MDLFSLGRLEIFSVGDLEIRNAMISLNDSNETRTIADLLAIACIGAAHRSVAAWSLW